MNKKEIIILDGYNVIHRVPELALLLEKGLQTAREGLLRFCSNWMATRRDAWMFYVVFDGQSGIIEGSHQPASGIRPIFTETGETADTRILRIIEQRAHDCNITVVSDDNFVRGNSRDLNATVISADDFFSIPSANRAGRKQSSGGSDKILSQQEKKSINDSLRKEWGIE